MLRTFKEWSKVAGKGLIVLMIVLLLTISLFGVIFFAGLWYFEKFM